MSKTIKSYITSRDIHQLRKVAKESDVTDIVSISDTVDEFHWPDFSRFKTPVTIHRFVIEDLDEYSVNVDKDLLPSESDVRKLVGAFFLMMQRDNFNILFHCNAGRHRSPAASFLFYVMAGYSYEDAYNRSKESSLSDEFAPNLLIIKHADRILAKNGEMLRFIVDKSNNKDYIEKFGY